MKDKVNIFIILLSMSVISIFLLSGCKTSTVTPEMVETEEVSPPSEEAPVPDDDTEPDDEPFVVRYGTSIEPDCLHHPWLCTSIWSLGDLLWEGFTGLGPNCEVIPRLAKEMDVSEDGLTWTLHLQEDVFWTDGEPFDAYDVEAYWDWVMTTDTFAYLPPTLKSVSWQALNEDTFEFTMSSPLGSWAHYDAVWQWPFAPQVWAETDNATMWEIPTEPIVTTGPFMLTEWERGSHLIFDANPNYYLGKPAVDRLVLQVYSNNDAMISALLSGDIDVIPRDLTPDYYAELAADANITIVEQPPGRQLSLAINVAAEGVMHPALNNKLVRHAIDYAIDKQNIIDLVLLGKGILCPNGGINCGPLYEWHLDPSQGPTPYDPNLAIQILDDEGYLDTDGDGVRETPDGEPLLFRLYFPVDSPTADSASLLVSTNLGEVGIATEISALEFATLQNVGYQERDFDLVIREWSGDADPAVGDFAASCWSSPPGTGLNFTGYCNPEYDALVQEHASTMGLENRLPIIYEAQRLLADDRATIILAGYTTMGAYRNDRVEMPNDPCSQLGLLIGWYSSINTTPVE
jgi:peptide/nickel transport system substrate-binding protein